MISAERRAAHYGHDSERCLFVAYDRERDRRGLWSDCDEGHHEKDFDIPLIDVMMKALEGRPSVAIDRNVLGGTPHIRGTRIAVFMVLDALEYYGTLEGVKKSYPKLTVEQVKDAVSFAAAVVEHPIDYEIKSSAR